MWHLFLQSFNETKAELKMRKQRELEEEKKIKDMETMPKAKIRQSINIPANIDVANAEGLTTIISFLFFNLTDLSLQMKNFSSLIPVHRWCILNLSLICLFLSVLVSPSKDFVRH